MDFKATVYKLHTDRTMHIQPSQSVHPHQADMKNNAQSTNSDTMGPHKNTTHYRSFTPAILRQYIQIFIVPHFW